MVQCYRRQGEKKITRELVNVVLARRPKMSNFLDWRNLKVSHSNSLKILIFIEKNDSQVYVK